MFPFFRNMVASRFSLLYWGRGKGHSHSKCLWPLSVRRQSSRRHLGRLGRCRVLRQGCGQLRRVLFRRLPLLQRRLDLILRERGYNQGRHDGGSRLLQHMVRGQIWLADLHEAKDGRCENQLFTFRNLRGTPKARRRVCHLLYGHDYGQGHTMPSLFSQCLSKKMAVHARHLPFMSRRLV